MTEEQEEHIVDIQETFDMMVASKYRKGAEEHGGDIRDRTTAWLIEQAMDEAIDQFVYLYTLRNKILDEENTE